jgi:hypothetical protein
VKELKNLLTDPARRQSIVKECAQLIDSEVHGKSGLSGMAVRAAYAVVKAFKPSMVENTVDALLDDFTVELQPIYAQYQEGSQGTLEGYFGAPRAADVAEKLLIITDRRAESTKHKTIAKTYFKLRPKAKEHVGQAAPGIGKILDRYVGAI